MREEAGSAFALLDEQGRVLARSEKLRQLLGEGNSEPAALEEALRAVALPGAQPIGVMLGGHAAVLHAERADAFLLARFEVGAPQEDERLRTFALLAEGMAHDARNPLNTLSIHLSLLGDRLSASDPALGERLGRHLKAMREGVNRVESTLHRFLQFASPSRSVGGPLDLGELVGQAVEAFGHEARRQGVTVETSLEGLTVEADASKLGEAVLQLVIGGIDAAGAGNRLEVRVERSGAEALLALREVPVDGAGCPELVAGGTEGERTLPFALRIIELHRGKVRTQQQGADRGVEVRLPLSGR